MKKGKRYLARFVSVLMIVMLMTSLALQAKAEDTETTPNILLYDSLLNDRHWVIDTFTKDAFPAANPHAGTNGVSGMDYLYKDILDKYTSDSIFKAGVDIYYNYEHVGDLLAEIPSGLADIFNTSSSWTSFLSGVKNKNYSAVLSKVFSSDYESESGMSLSSTLSDLQTLRTYYSTASKIKSSYKDVSGWLGMIEDVNNTFQYEYVTKALPEFSDHIYGYIDGIDSVLNDASAATGKSISDFNNLFEAQYYALYGSEDDSVNTWRTSLEIGNFADSMSKYLKSAQTAANVSTSYLDNIILLESLFEQRDSLSDTLKRTQGYASGDLGYIRVSNQYLEMMSNDYNNGDSILMEACKNTLNSEIQSRLNKYMWKEAKKGVTSSMSSFLARNAASKEASSVFIATKAESMSSLLGLGTFLTDQVTGFGDTCEKIYEMKYLERVKGYAIEAYREDEAAYTRAMLSGANRDVLDEYAKNALDDLTFLQKLTLRENEIAYKMMTNQSDSYVGRLFDAVYGGNTSVDLDYMWTKMQNALVDTTINPISETPMEIKSGETLTVYKTDSDYWGVYEKSGGKKVTLAEMEYRLLGGLNLNGGNVVFMNQTEEDIYVNCLNVSSSSTISLSGEILVGEMSLSGSLEIEQGGLKTVGNLTVQSGTLTVGSGRVEIDGDLTVEENGYVCMKDEAGYVLVNGNMTEYTFVYQVGSKFEKGTLELKGDLTSAGEGWGWDVEPGFQMVFSGEGKQKVSIPSYGGVHNNNMLGDVTVSSAGLITDTGFAALKLESDINVEGNVGYLSILNWNGHTVKNDGTVSIAGTNQEDGGMRLECTGDIVFGSSSYVGNGYIKTDGNLTVRRTLTVGSGRVEIDGDLTVEENGYVCMKDEAGYVLVNGDMTEYTLLYQKGSEFKKGTLELKGDLTSAGEGWGWGVDPGFKMVFSGGEKQKVNIPFYGGASYNNMLGEVTVSSAGLTTDTGFAALKLDSDINMEGDVGYFSINNWNDKTVKLSNQSSIPTVSLASGYGQLISHTAESEDSYNITYAPCTTTYSCKYYVGTQLKKTVTQYQKGSLVIPYQPTLSSGQEFAGWYTDRAMTQPWDIKKDTIIEDISLYAKIIVPVTGIELQDSLILEEIGSKAILSATVLPSNTTEKNIAWSSSDEAVATVSDTGEVTAVSVGEATITARAGNCEASCSVEVKKKATGETPENPAKVVSIAVTAQPDLIVYKAGEHFDPTGLKVAANYSDGTTEEITDYTIEPDNRALTLLDTEVIIRYTQDENTFTVVVPIQVIEEISDDIVIDDLKVNDAYGKIDGNTITVVLPVGSELEVTLENITIQSSKENAKIQNLRFDNTESIWKFSVGTSDDTVGTEYMLNISVAENEEAYKAAQWNAVESAVERFDYNDHVAGIFTDGNNGAIEQDEIAEKLAMIISQMPIAQWADISVSASDIHISEYTLPIAGDADIPEGCEGTFAFKLSIASEANAIDTDVITCKLIPTAYVGITNREVVQKAVNLIESADISFSQENVQSQDMAIIVIVERVNQILAENHVGIQITDGEVTINHFIPAKNGTDGSVAYTISLKLGKIEKATNKINSVIRALESKLSHNYNTTIIPATVGGNGSVIEKCSICGDIKSNTTIYAIKGITLKTTKYTYSGKAKKPSVIVKDSKGNVIPNSNYAVSYKNNKSVGKATVKITFKGKYSGVVSKTFSINPKGTSVSSVAAESKGFTVKWKKQAVQTTGYEIQYSTNKKFTKKTTATKIVKKASATKLSIRKLKANKKYYVRIRTYKTVKGKKYYSGWSKNKSVAVRK